MVFVLLASSLALAQTTLPNRFFEIEPYAPGSAEMQCATEASEEWSVSFQNKKLSFEPAVSTDSKTIEFDGGKFMADDFGEFGGKLVYAGMGDHQLLLRENTRFVIRLEPNKVVAFGGVSHMTIDNGFAAFLARKSEKLTWFVERKLTLPGNPAAVTAKSGRFLMVTKQGVYELKTESEKATLVHKMDLTNLYPNSIALSDDGLIFIGMRHAVARLNSTGKPNLKWLVKKKCAKAKEN